MHGINGDIKCQEKDMEKKMDQNVDLMQVGEEKIKLLFVGISRGGRNNA